MAYDEPLADRVRVALGPRARVDEIKMFGGLCFMVNGHMTVGIIGDALMVRVGAENYAKVVSRRHAGPMTFTGKPMKGIILVDAAGCSSLRQVKSWVAAALAFTATLPPKKPARPRKRALRKA
jgi:hypothetical protein